MSEYSIAGISFAFTVTSVGKVELVPERQNIVNRFDEHGDLLTLDRLPEEGNASFRQRMLDVTVNRGSPTYEGFINNLARELGLSKFKAITIDLVLGSDGEPLATNPRVDILASEVILYKEWNSSEDYEIDKTINIYDLGTDCYYLSDLINEINTSEYFTASLVSGVRPNLLSTCLVRGNTHRREDQEVAWADQQTRLKDTEWGTRPRTHEGSFWFSEKNVFVTEVAGEPENPGEYSIDYYNGYLVSYDIPSGTGRFGYTYGEFPYTAYASLVQLYSLQDENFTKKLFAQEVLESGEEVNALPNAEGSEIIHQLYKDTKVFWGA
jgi:hypothetical protein